MIVLCPGELINLSKWGRFLEGFPVADSAPRKGETLRPPFLCRSNGHTVSTLIIRASFALPYFFWRYDWEYFLDSWSPVFILQGTPSRRL